MNKILCPNCSKELKYLYFDADKYHTYWCRDCLLRYRERDDGTKENTVIEIPKDIIERLNQIGYSIGEFAESHERVDKVGMYFAMDVLESNKGNYPKAMQVLSDKIQKTSHPSLNQYQVNRIEAYLKNGCSIRGTVNSCKADGFDISKSEVHRIKMELQKKGILPYGS